MTNEPKSGTSEDLRNAERASFSEARARLAHIRRVLIVDDNWRDRFLMRDLLSEMNCECEEATSGHAAVDTVKIKDFDVALVDWKLVGMDGLECCERIKEAKPSVRTVILTGHPEGITSDMLVKSGVVMLVNKSGNREILREAINKMFNALRI